MIRRLRIVRLLEVINPKWLQVWPGMRMTVGPQSSREGLRCASELRIQRVLATVDVFK
jgi:hypothetical protein